MARRTLSPPPADCIAAIGSAQKKNRNVRPGTIILCIMNNDPAARPACIPCRVEGFEVVVRGRPASRTDNRPTAVHDVAVQVSRALTDAGITAALTGGAGASRINFETFDPAPKPRHLNRMASASAEERAAGKNSDPKSESPRNTPAPL